MDEIKIVAKNDIIGLLGHHLFFKGRVYRAWKAYPDDDELWIVESEFAANEFPTYDWNFILQNFETIDEIRDSKIESILEKI